MAEAQKPGSRYGITDKAFPVVEPTAGTDLKGRAGYRHRREREI